MIKKIMVLGCSGAGKSTISFKLSDHFQLPIFHMDQLFWKSGWVESEREEWIAKHEKIMKLPAWVIDGNYHSTMDERLEHTDLIIYMDLPRWMCLWGVIKRRIQYQGKARPEMNEGCKERINWEFFKYVWSFHKEQRPTILEKINRYEGKKTIHRVRSRKEAKALLEHL